MTEKTSLSKRAYGPIPDGETYDPYVPAIESPLEGTTKAMVAGILFGILFGAANAYLGLRARLTISTSIPVAVMTVATFKLVRFSEEHLIGHYPFNLVGLQNRTAYDRVSVNSN